jgi:hypothetical protein
MGKTDIIKTGTEDWWMWVSMIKVAEQYRERFKLPPDSPVEISVFECNKFINSISDDPLTRERLLSSVGDLSPDARDKFGKCWIIKDERGKRTFLTKE